MRYIMIWLRRPLFLAALTGVCLLSLRWGALAANPTPPRANGMPKTAPVTDPSTDPPQTAESVPVVEAPPSAEPPPASKLSESQYELTQEISLQETLDRLGYTVNVPTVYDGHTLRRWNNYRSSTDDDSIPAERFHCGRSATFAMLGQQAMCAPHTVFGCIDAAGRMTELFQPDPNSSGMWLNAVTPHRITVDLHGSVRFFIEDTSHSLGIGTLYSTAQSNFDRASHLLVFPAITGGTWVDEGNNRGHWKGGKSRGYLLCWEDWNDFDYQDIVILAEQIEPGLPDSAA